MLEQIQHEIRDQTSAQAQQEAKQKLTWRAFQEAEQEAAMLEDLHARGLHRLNWFRVALTVAGRVVWCGGRGAWRAWWICGWRSAVSTAKWWSWWACMVDSWVRKRGVDRQVVVVVGVHGGFVGGDASIAIMTGDPHRHGPGTASATRGKRRAASLLVGRLLQRQQRSNDGQNYNDSRLHLRRSQRRSKLMGRPLARGKPC